MFCPPLGWDDLLLQAAKEWGYPTLADWQNESVYNKGIVLGHYLWMQRREAYESDRQQEHHKNKKPEEAPKKPHAAFRYGGDILRARLAAQQRGEGNA